MRGRLQLPDPSTLEVQSLHAPIQRHVRYDLRKPEAARSGLLAIAIFVNGAKGHSALQVSRDLDCQYKTAFVLSHKIREAIAAEPAMSRSTAVISAAT